MFLAIGHVSQVLSSMFIWNPTQRPQYWNGKIHGFPWTQQRANWKWKHILILCILITLVKDIYWLKLDCSLHFSGRESTLSYWRKEWSKINSSQNPSMALSFVVPKQGEPYPEGTPNVQVYGEFQICAHYKRCTKCHLQ